MNVIYKTELKEKSELYIFSDFEALTNENKNHQVNLSVSMYFENDEPIIHKNIYDYVKWLLNPKHKKYTVIFHNGSGYDFSFILREMLENNLIPNVIMDGTRIKYMEIKKLKMRFIDSFLFTISPLKSFTKMFDLNNPEIIKKYKFDDKPYLKGDFPHLFNTPENQNYIGPIPDKKFYGIDLMKSNEKCKYDKNNKLCDSKCARCNFIKWHNDKLENNYIINF